MDENPCIRCGVCCAHYRVSFYWAECDDVAINGVPAQLTEDLTPFRRVMKGTDSKNPRCVALQGELGEHVLCSIYEHRPSVCRIFKASFEEGEPNPDCDMLRFRHGLPPLSPADWKRRSDTDPEHPVEPPRGKPRAA